MPVLTGGQSQRIDDMLPRCTAAQVKACFVILRRKPIENRNFCGAELLRSHCNALRHAKRAAAVAAAALTCRPRIGRLRSVRLAAQEGRDVEPHLVLLRRARGRRARRRVVRHRGSPPAAGAGSGRLRRIMPLARAGDAAEQVAEAAAGGGAGAAPRRAARPGRPPAGRPPAARSSAPGRASSAPAARLTAPVRHHLHAGRLAHAARALARFTAGRSAGAGACHRAARRRAGRRAGWHRPGRGRRPAPAAAPAAWPAGLRLARHGAAAGIAPARRSRCGCAGDRCRWRRPRRGSPLQVSGSIAEPKMMLASSSTSSRMRFAA